MKLSSLLLFCLCIYTTSLSDPCVRILDSVQPPGTTPPLGHPCLPLFNSSYLSSSFPLLASSAEKGLRSSGTCRGVILSCNDKLNRRTVLVRPVSKQDTFSHFSGFFPPVRIQFLSFSLDFARGPLTVALGSFTLFVLEKVSNLKTLETYKLLRHT